MDRNVSLLLPFAAFAAAVVAGCGARAENLATQGATRGVFRAERHGRTVRVEVGLEKLPPSASVVTMGLKLADGTPLYPQTICGLSGPAADLREARRVGFAFRPGPATQSAGIRPEFWVQVTFELGALARSVHGGTFSLVLGDPTASQSCGMGITTSVMTRDGSPCPVDCVELAEFYKSEFIPMPLPRVTAPPTVSIHLAETPAKEPGGTSVPIVPTLAAETTHEAPPILAAMR